MKWFRCYNEITRDRKLRRHSPAVRWVWITLLSMANESPQRGLVLLCDGIPATIEDIADEAAVSKKEVEEALAVFSEQKQIENVGDTWKVIKWDNRQFAKDDVSFRVQKHRDRKNVTPLKHPDDVSSNTDVTPPDTDTDTDTDTEEIPPTPFTEKSNGKFSCSSKEITSWVHKHEGFFSVAPDCIKALLEEFSECAVIDGLQRCNSWIAASGKKPSNINMTLNKFMEDYRAPARDEPEDPDDVPFDYPELPLTRSARIADEREAAAKCSQV